MWPSNYNGKLNSYPYCCWLFLKDYAEQVQPLGVEVTSQELKHEDKTYTFLVDEWKLGFDYAGWAVTPYTQYRHVFKLVCLPVHEHLRTVSPAPKHVAYSWALYQRLLAENVEPLPQVSARFRSDDSTRPRLQARRDYVRSLLKLNFGDQVETNLIPPAQCLRKIQQSLVTVHTGGDFAGHVDRTTYEVMALGRCLVQPTIQGFMGDVVPEHGVHYVACRYDYQDLVAKVRWCLDHPAEARAIGKRAQALYVQQDSPEPFWRRVVRSCEEGV